MDVRRERASGGPGTSARAGSERSRLRSRRAAVGSSALGALPRRRAATSASACEPTRRDSMATQGSEVQSDPGRSAPAKSSSTATSSIPRSTSSSSRTSSNGRARAASTRSPGVAPLGLLRRHLRLRGRQFAERTTRRTSTSNPTACRSHTAPSRPRATLRSRRCQGRAMRATASRSTRGGFASTRPTSISPRVRSSCASAGRRSPGARPTRSGCSTRTTPSTRPFSRACSSTSTSRASRCGRRGRTYQLFNNWGPFSSGFLDTYIVPGVIDINIRRSRCRA